MTCPKCHGLVVEDTMYSDENFMHRMEGIRCLNCGFVGFTREPTAEDHQHKVRHFSRHKGERPPGSGKQKGHKATPEQRRKISEGLKEAYRYGRR